MLHSIGSHGQQVCYAISDYVVSSNGNTACHNLSSYYDDSAPPEGSSGQVNSAHPKMSSNDETYGQGSSVPSRGFCSHGNSPCVPDTSCQVETDDGICCEFKLELISVSPPTYSNRDCYIL